MARSPEYPDLPWVPPRSWTDANRSSVQLVVIHTTEGSARGSAAEDGAAYDQRRTDGTSAHFFHDSDSTVQCVRTADIAHTARRQGNLRGIHHELCTRSGSADWDDTYHAAMLRRAAKQAARDCRKWGISPVKLSSAQVRAGVKGICGHVDITNAFPEDHGDHTDPGPRFPWAEFIGLVRAELEGDDVTPEDVKAIADATAAKVLGRTWTVPGRTLAGSVEALIAMNQNAAVAYADILRQISADDTNEVVIPAELIPQLGELIAARLPIGVTADEVRAVVDEELDEQSRSGADAD
jgi:N-acetylmuramoyl-L-alanine amidase-like protein